MLLSKAYSAQQQREVDSMSQTLVRSEPSSRVHAVRRVLWIVLLLNLVVAGAKFTYGVISGSASMQADGIHSVFDSAGNVVGLIGIALAARPADVGHPYGHAKFETYASLIIGVLLLAAAVEVGVSAVQKLISQNYTADVTMLSFVVMIATLGINIGVTRYERKQGRLLKSEILLADASHTLSDALVSVGVIVGLVCVALGFPIADPIMALVVMIAILATAIDVFKRGLTTLSDHARIPEQEVLAVVKRVGGVSNAHKIRTRGTEDEVYVDLHVLVDPAMTVLQAHAVADEVECALQEAFDSVRDVVVHIEPDDGHVE